MISTTTKIITNVCGLMRGRPFIASLPPFVFHCAGGARPDSMLAAWLSVFLVLTVDVDAPPTVR